MKLLSQASIYGIRAVLYIASLKDQQEYIPVRQIAEFLNISYHFLAKVVQTLTQNNILESYRGPNGGVSLAQSADKIRLINLIEAVEGTDFFSKCILGLSGCGEGVPCPLHTQWGQTREEIKGIFANTTLAELGEAITREGLRIVSSE